LKVDNNYNNGNSTPRPSDLSNSSKDMNVLKKIIKSNLKSFLQVASTGGSKKVSPISTPKVSPPKSFSEKSDQEKIDINEIPIM
ncbi:15297_t:CDS:2, partial [Funneliformis geosporum]